MAEPSATDPLCQAVARAVGAGIVVVASAGNYGTSASGAPVLGGITSPGNSPLAITVGAIDTYGHARRRPTTRSRPTARAGRPRYELAVKPDVVAPGTKLVSLEAPGSYLDRAYPAVAHRRQRQERLHAPERHQHGGRGRQRRRRAAARTRSPSLTPAQVKVALQMGARFMPDGGSSAPARAA